MFQLRVRGDIPPARERHSCSIIAGKKVYIFGGFNRTSDMYYNSVFLFDSGMYLLVPTTQIHLVTLTWHRVETHGHIPERRCGHAAAVVDGKIWVFGGRVKVKLGDSFLDDSVTQYRNDLHCFDPGMRSHTKTRSLICTR